MRRLLPISFAVALTLSLGSADAFAKANVAVPAPAPTTETEPVASVLALAEAMGPLAEAMGLASLEGSYAQREQEAKALETFEGGDVLVISGSAIAIALLIVLLIVLL